MVMRPPLLMMRAPAGGGRRPRVPSHTSAVHFVFKQYVNLEYDQILVDERALARGQEPDKPFEDGVQFVEHGDGRSTPKRNGRAVDK